MPSKAFKLAEAMVSNPVMSDIVTDTAAVPVSITNQIEISTDQGVASVEDLPNTGNSAGDIQLVESTNRLYVWNGSGWYNIALINTTPTWDSGGQPNASYILDADSPQGATVITLAASDPEGLTISYTYVTSGQMDSIATVSQDSSVFTITPKTVAQAPDGGTGSITFRATDGINILPQVSSFTLNFISTIQNSKYTTLLATAVDTSDNNNITDASSNSHSITVNGDAYAGTFSPYRHGGYSTYFDGTGDNLAISANSDFDFGTGDFTFEMSFYAYATSGGGKYLITNRASGWGAGVFQFMVSAAATNIYCTFYGYDLGGYTIVPETWYHISAVKSGDTITLYLNGGTPTAGGGYSQSHSGVNNVSMGSSGKAVDIGSNGSSDYFKGYIRDLRIVKGTVITPPSGGPTERLEAVTNTSLLTCHLPYISDGSTNDHSITINGDPETKPFSPYDYGEYSEADHGGSVYFVGGADYSSQYLSLSGPTMPSGDFTLSTWVYLTHTVADSKTLIDFNGNSGGFRIMYSNVTTGTPYHFRFYTAGGTVYLYDSTSAHPLNQWHYIVVVRDSGTFKLYVNNKLMGTSTANPTFSSSNNVRIGQSLSGSGTLEGYLSDIIYNPTTAITDFTPPTAPLSSTGASLHIKGTDASIIDKSQSANLKLEGSVAGSTTQVKFASTKSMKFDSVDDLINLNGVLDLSQACTWEAWVYFDNHPTASGFMHMFQSASYSSTDPPFGIRFKTTGGMKINFVLYTTSGNHEVQSPSAVSLDTWYHLAFSRTSSGVYNVYIDGTRYSTFTESATYQSAGDVMVIGNSGTGSTPPRFLDGYMQDIRITQGLALYTAADETSNIPSAPLEG